MGRKMRGGVAPLAIALILAGCASDPKVFRIEPLHPVAELRQEALAATPPVQPGDVRPSNLVELVTLDPTIRLDIRYATKRNFLGDPLYSQPRAFLQRPAAEALVRAHRWLRAQGSRHNRGCAVDLTLYDLKSGRAVEMPSLYDEMSARAFADYPGGTDEQRRLRALLRTAMEAQGFTVYPQEWWHFDYRDWQSYAVQNARFEDLGSAVARP